WEPPRGGSGLFPTEERAILKNDANWTVWSNSFISAAAYSEAHLTSFQEGINQLAACNLALPERFAAGFFVASLWRDPDDANSWHTWVESFKLTDATTLTTAIHDLKSTVRIRGTASSSSSSLQSALVTVEKDRRKNGRNF
ncbi:hypothetical protein R3P38DRAFT_2378952, partial [Favolaschia claudopus]